MALSWNEIRERAVSFSKEWEGTANEEADAKPFLEAFFNVFEISRKRVSTFEHRVKKLDDRDGYIDLLMNWTKPLTSEANRMEFLFELYVKYTDGLFVKENKKK